MKTVRDICSYAFIGIVLFTGLTLFENTSVKLTVVEYMGIGLMAASLLTLAIVFALWNNRTGYY